MKKLYSLLLIAAAAMGFMTSCSDVPMPYDIHKGEANSFGKTLPYKSASLNTGWTTYALTENEPWSQGSSYTQATGYQDWDGTGTKSNKTVESYLISPAFNTTCESGKVKFSFDNTIRYENNVSNWKNNHKIFISKNYDGYNFNAASWEQIAWTPVASTTNDWTLYSSGEIQIPEAYVNTDSVYIAFYFYAPAGNSTTWELENFLIQEGEADNTGGGDTPVTPSGDSTKDNPYSVVQAKSASGMAYVKGYIVGYINGTKLEEGATFAVPEAAETEILIADNADETNPANVFPVQLPSGSIRNGLELFAHPSYLKKEVVLYGSLETYFGTAGMKNTSWAMIEGTEIGQDPDKPVDNGTPTGDGSQAAPFNPAAAIAHVKSLGADVNSSDVYVKGKITSISEVNTDKYGNAKFTIQDVSGTGPEFMAYNCFYLGNTHFTSKDQIKVGDEVVIYGPIVNYKGNTPETVSSKCYIYSLNGKTEGGNDTPGDNEEGGENAGSSDAISISGTNVVLTNSSCEAGSESVTIDLNTLGFENAGDVTTVTFSDGTTATFGSGTNTNNAPKFYTATKGVRLYAHNTITFAGTKTIAKVVMTCDSYSGTDYVGNPTATASFDGKNATYVNYHTDTKGGTQLRVQTITITYAK